MSRSDLHKGMEDVVEVGVEGEREGAVTSSTFGE